MSVLFPSNYNACPAPAKAIFEKAAHYHYPVAHCKMPIGVIRPDFGL